MSRRRLLALLACVLVSCVVTRAHATEPLRSVRGIASHVDVEYAPRLRSRSDQSPTSSVLVRVSQVRGTGSDAPPRQRIEFIGTVPGSFDLRDFIEREDGRAITELAELPILVGSQLPADAGTDLYSSGASWFNWAAHYRLLMWIAAALWLAIPAAYLLLRALRKPPAPAPIPQAVPPPTIEAQLIEAIHASANRPLTTDERGRLELLVFRYLGGTTTGPSVTPSDIVQTFREIRQHADTRSVVTALESWLHARDGEHSRAAAAAALDELRRSRLSGLHATPSIPPHAGEAAA